MPSGILFPGCTCVIGNGVVVDPGKLLEEMDGLRDRGIEIGSNLRISSRAHVVMPYHKAIDGALEEFVVGGGRNVIGTTRRGIVPAYADKVVRSTAIRIGDLMHADRLEAKLDLVCRLRCAQLRSLGLGDSEIAEVTDPVRLLEVLREQAARLEPHVCDTTWLLHDELDAGRRLLFEGANACLLDVDHGTYPFVTSSNTIAGQAATGSGMGPAALNHVLGITKAYTTRVGEGPFPTEQDNETGQKLGERGHEFGTVTGRKRRCGWFDAVLVRQIVRTAGIDGIALTKLDVLDGFDEINICTGYMLDGAPIDYLPANAAEQARIEPVYETLSGWGGQSSFGARSWADLPAEAVRYVRYIEELIGAPVTLLSTSPERDDTILVKDPFED